MTRYCTLCAGRTRLDVRVAHFFFFQAEDGIRDYKVTGVQTCALPIYPRGLLERRRGNERLCRETRLGDAEEQRLGSRRLDALLHHPLVHLAERQLVHEIGRASCRERV